MPRVPGTRVGKIKKADGTMELVEIRPMVVVPNRHYPDALVLFPALDPFNFKGTTAEFVEAFKRALVAAGYGPGQTE